MTILRFGDQLKIDQRNKHATHTTATIYIDQLALAHDCSSTNCEENGSRN